MHTSHTREILPPSNVKFRHRVGKTQTNVHNVSIITLRFLNVEHQIVDEVQWSAERFA